MFLEIEPIAPVSLPDLIARRKQIHQRFAAAAARVSKTAPQSRDDLPGKEPPCPPTATAGGSAPELSTVTAGSPDAHTPYRPMIRRILSLVAQVHGLSTADLMSSQRTRRLTIPRQIAMALARELTPLSLPGIGKRIGGRDHTTVLHAIRKIRHLAATEPEIASSIAELRKRLTMPPEALPLAMLIASGPIPLACPPGPHPHGHGLAMRKAPHYVPPPIISLPRISLS